MRATYWLILGTLIANHASAEALNYPPTRKEAVSDVYHGTKVEDPYRWLEDDNADDTKAWVKAQNEVTHQYLTAIPQRDVIRDRLKQLWNFERVGLPDEEGGKWFYVKNSGLQEQGVLYVADSLNGDPRVLLDPNPLSTDGTVSLAQYRPSEDGKLLAYATSGGGSDWLEIRVRDVTTAKDLADHLKWIKFSGISWAKDSSGFYYSRYAEPAAGAALTQKNEFQKLYFHRIGTEQSADELIYEIKDQPQWGLGGGVTEDGKYLIMDITQGSDTKNRVYYKSLPSGEVVKLLDDNDASYEFVANDGPVFYFVTDLNAPRRRVVAIDTREPHPGHWKEVIRQTDDTIDGVSRVGGKLIVTCMKDAHNLVTRFDADGENPLEIPVPGLGNIGGFGGKDKDKTVFYSFTGFTNPGAIYQFDIAEAKSTLWKKPTVGFDGDAYETEQVFYKSKDGTKVPMFIVHRKGVKLDGTNRTLLYAYGGFGISTLPGFAVTRAVWLERGGVLAVANIRGGGEYGKAWHDAGKIHNKQNCFDDFIAAGEALIAKGYTKPANLAIQGGSNGGLLVGACMTQRPELFGAALPAVGVMDMLRFQRFTIGWAWEKEYGSSSNADDFPLLLRYSPYHALKPGTRYPATLVTTADHDDRVVPAHSFKFAARLQEYQAKDGPPVLIRVESSAGHGAGTALSKSIERTADEWAFLEAALPGK